MTPSLLSSRRPPLLDELELAFDELRASDLPDEHWERALAAPLRDLLTRPGKQFRARLVHAAWTLAGGRGAPPAVLPLIVEVLHAGSLVIDDIEDDSSHRRGAPALHRRFGLPLALNAGNWLYFWPFALLSRCGLSPRAELELHRRMARALLRCHQGQALDLGTRICEVPRAEVAAVVGATTSLKTASLMELAAVLGAVAAGAPSDRVAALADLGGALGVGLQMLDDLGGLGGRDPHKRFEDLRNGRPAWPWAWLADTAADDEWEALQDVGRRVAAGTAEAAPLADILRARVGERGRREARAHLDAALAAIESTVGECRALARDIDRLETSYE